MQDLAQVRVSYLPIQLGGGGQALVVQRRQANEWCSTARLGKAEKLEDEIDDAHGGTYLTV